MLQVRNLNVRYGNVQVLWDVSCEVNEGEFVSVIGPNASGKTTLIKSIVRLVKPEKGDVIFDGREIRSPEEAVKKRLVLRDRKSISWDDCFRKFIHRRASSTKIREKKETQRSI